jgi:hypothetical protein
MLAKDSILAGHLGVLKLIVVLSFLGMGLLHGPAYIQPLPWVAWPPFQPGNGLQNIASRIHHQEGQLEEKGAQWNGYHLISAVLLKQWFGNLFPLVHADLLTHFNGHMLFRPVSIPLFV